MVILLCVCVPHPYPTPVQGLQVCTIIIQLYAVLGVKARAFCMPYKHSTKLATFPALRGAHLIHQCFVAFCFKCRLRFFRPSNDFSELVCIFFMFSNTVVLLFSTVEICRQT